MKKVVLGAALLLLISAAHASTGNYNMQKGQPHAERNILSNQLPVALLADIKKGYKDYWITALSEEAKGRHSDYFITLENADQIVQLRSSGAEKWVVMNTVQKTGI